MKAEAQVAKPSANSGVVATSTSKLGNETLLAALREMLRIRRLEERAAKLYREGKFGGFCHLVIGQEAVAVGISMAKEPSDDILTTYRDHGLALTCGLKPAAVLAELLGRETGCSKGRGGSMHMFSREQHFHGGHGIVGAHVPLGAGLAFANKYKGNGAAAICMLGDGAVPNGAFHEALNLAGLWRLPYIVIIENNGYGMGTAVSRSNAITDLHDHAERFNMIAMVCNGMDFEDVHEKVSQALAYARENKPVLLEARTYRYFGHSMSDPVAGVYRTKEEIEEVKKADPIARLSMKLIELGALTDADFKALDKQISKEMLDAVEEAMAGPEPGIDTVYNHIYANPQGMIPGYVE